MDDRTRKHDPEQDEEKAFVETLTSEHNPAQTPPPPAKTKTVAGRPPAWAGKIMGHFKLLRMIGEGAMGMVIQAEDTGLRRIVALKVLRKQLAAGEKGKKTIEQFLREARAAAALEHPNIVRVYEINQHAGWWYIAMEMVDGNSLQEIIKAAGCLPEGRACPIIADAALALQAAHEVGMIHRDVKPGNILVTRNGRGKLTDFGLVRVDDPNDPDDTYARKSIGTPMYMAPEIIRHQPISPAVDIYGLGATLYYTLTGRPPYCAEKIEDILDQHLNNAPPNLQDYLEQSSPTLTTLIQRMMAKDPTARPSAAEVAAILRAEAISIYPESMGQPSPGGTAIGTNWLGTHQSTKLGSTEVKTRTLETTQGAGRPQWTAAMRHPWKRAGIALTVLLLSTLTFWLYNSVSQSANRTPSITGLFPVAPDSYGTQPAGSLPKAPAAAADPPPFSWKTQTELPDSRFVAGRTGRYYYPVDDPRAHLIRAEHVVGYQTEDQAKNDGKIPAP